MMNADASILEEAMSAKQMDAKNVVFIVDVVLYFLIIVSQDSVSIVSSVEYRK